LQSSISSSKDTLNQKLRKVLTANFNPGRWDIDFVNIRSENEFDSKSATG